MTFPPDLVYLQPFASRCQLVGDDNACEEVWATMMVDQRAEALDLLRRVVANKQKEQLTAWASTADSDDAGEGWCLVILFDFLVRTGKVPPELANENFIAWDMRDCDDHGHAW